MAIFIPNLSQTAGIPSQWDDTISAADIHLITGDEPEVFTEDLLFEINQTIEALTVVGFNANGRVVPATSTVEASGDLTFTAAGVAAETITIGTTVYTLRAAPTTVAGEVKIGASAAETAANLIAAINTDAGAGTLYGSLTISHPDVNASAGAAGVVHLTAKVGGTAANAIATTETSTVASFGATTLTGGTATPVTRAIGINVVKVVTPANGHHMGSPVYRAGVFNPLALIWDASYSTEAEKLGAFRGAPSPTTIIMRRPKTATVGPSVGTSII
jgi:hypothetical protein